MVLLLLAPGLSSAQDSREIEFDIFQIDKALAVWFDLAPVISSKRVSQMQDGIDLAVEYSVSLRRPRKLWGSQLIDRREGMYRIGHRLVTEDFLLSDVTADTTVQIAFLSLAKLHQYLTDSIIVTLCAMDSLEDRQKYYMELKLTCISLTSINLAADGEAASDGESPVKYLFKKFLEATDFGREDYAVRSRSFSKDEITAHP